MKRPKTCKKCKKPIDNLIRIWQPFDMCSVCYMAMVIKQETVLQKFIIDYVKEVMKGNKNE